MANRKANISLIIGLALPALMVVIIAALVFLPSRALNPTSDFVYATGPYPSYATRSGETITQHELVIRNGKITDTVVNYTGREIYAPYPNDVRNTPRFFIHRTVANTNKEITLDEAKKLTLSPDRTSPDGFTLTFGKRSYGIFPFFFDDSSSTERAYLSTDRGSKEITLISDTSIRPYELQLVGWVL